MSLILVNMFIKLIIWIVFLEFVNNFIDNLISSSAFLIIIDNLSNFVFWSTILV